MDACPTALIQIIYVFSLLAVSTRCPHLLLLFSQGGDFLVNGSQLAFGVRQNGQPVNNVQLPAWASGPDDMLAKHRCGRTCSAMQPSISSSSSSQILPTGPLCK
jgi:hypothetical protein